MTFSEIYNAVVEARFKSSQTMAVKRWVNMREAQVWSAAEWPWKLVGPTTLAVDASDNTPTVPTDTYQPLAVYDDRGERLEYFTQSDFDDVYIPGQINSTTGRPRSFKWNDRVLTLGDTPDTSYTFQMTYIRKLCHYTSLAVLTSGPMSADTDYPVYDNEWHQMLVVGAIATGLKIENDPTWEPLEMEFSTTLATMIEHYLPAVAVAGNMQYGADWN